MTSRFIRSYAADILTGHGHRCTSVSDPRDAIERIDDIDPDVILVDLMMPSMNGIEFIKHVGRSHPDLPIIMLTAFASMESTVEAIECGAFDFLHKPLCSDELVQRVQKALPATRRNDSQSIASRRPESRMPFGDLVGKSSAMRGLYKRILAASAYDMNVLLCGESGTGKELTAKAIHKSSGRASHPYVVIDCASMTQTLIESELFGHERGAFTGAARQKPGLLESANRGTVFLDEITEMNIEMQSRLLRFLEQGQVRRVGGGRHFDINVRVIAATNRDPWEAIGQDRLREDLFYRLNGIMINLPPLRQRGQDLSLLCTYFLRRIAFMTGETMKSFEKNAFAALERYRWPGMSGSFLN